MHMMWARKFACDWTGWDDNMARMTALIEKSVRPPSLPKAASSASMSQGTSPPFSAKLARFAL